jgi:hypothetical protein
MTKSLIIVFVKNLVEGRVKTRLAKSIGNFAALEVYGELLNITEKAVLGTGLSSWVFFSDHIEETHWKSSKKFVQSGEDLGARMKQAFEQAFAAGYESVILIGSDLPDIDTALIKEGFSRLKQHEVVFGTAEDGGYYLVGLNSMVNDIFSNKPWSTPHLLSTTLQELKALGMDIALLNNLNDIDTVEDLRNSGFLNNRPNLKQTIEQYND